MMSELLSVKLIELFEHQENYNTQIKYEQLKENDIKNLEQLQKENKISYSYTGGSESSLQITSNSFIGSLSLTGPNVRINILPKIFKDNANK